MVLVKYLLGTTVTMIVLIALEDLDFWGEQGAHKMCV